LQSSAKYAVHKVLCNETIDCITSTKIESEHLEVEIVEQIVRTKHYAFYF